MDLKEWLKPRVLISGGVGLLLAFVTNWLLLTTSLASVPCRVTGGTLWIDLHDTSETFFTPVCVGQVVGWRSAKQFTVKFKDTHCVDQLKYLLN